MILLGFRRKSFYLLVQRNLIRVRQRINSIDTPGNILLNVGIVLGATVYIQCISNVNPVVLVNAGITREAKSFVFYKIQCIIYILH